MKNSALFLLLLFIFQLLSCEILSDVHDERWKDDGVKYRQMIIVGGGTYPQTDGTTTFNHTISSFKLARYEVTYEVWYKVYQWAILNGYSFANPGREGSAGGIGTEPTEAKYEPVTTVSWRDIIVWCNAYNEMCEMTPCYTYSGSVIKDSTNAAACDGAVCNWTSDGYRLPSEGEWQYAARDKGVVNWSYVPGGTTGVHDITDVNPANGVPDNKDIDDLYAVYYYYYSFGSTWDATGVTKTANVGSKRPNGLGIYDMGGNVWDFCWDWNSADTALAKTDYRGETTGTNREMRGGGWQSYSQHLQPARTDFLAPGTANVACGFRLARSL